jgi:site-specific DNA-methyltransferase (adenine-specific)
MSIDFRVGDCLEIFGQEPDASFDAIVADLPAGVSFMSRAWDGDHGHRDRWIAFWAERLAMVRQKCKPGAYALLWALPRTSGWTHMAIEDGGWYVQDVITHAFGTGWPKSHAALKPASEHWILARNGTGGDLQIDAARVQRGPGGYPIPCTQRESRSFGNRLGGSTSDSGGLVKLGPEAAHPAGSWPTNLVLSHCPECEERGTRMVKGGTAHPGSPDYKSAEWGTIGRNHDRPPQTYAPDGQEEIPAFDCLASCDCGQAVLAPSGGAAPRCACGRPMWWACAVAELDAQSGYSKSPPVGSVARVTRPRSGYTVSPPPMELPNGHGDEGGRSRYFPRFCYQAKASGGERDAGCEGLYWRRNPRNPFGYDVVDLAEYERLVAAAEKVARGNVHPTVKGVALMEWLVSLVCPPGGRLGDVTLGSGGTAVAYHRVCERARVEPSFLGTDICPEAVAIAEARMRWWRSVRLDTKPRAREERGVGGKGKKPKEPSLFDV